MSLRTRSPKALACLVLALLPAAAPAMRAKGGADVSAGDAAGHLEVAPGGGHRGPAPGTRFSSLAAAVEAGAAQGHLEEPPMFMRQGTITVSPPVDPMFIEEKGSPRMMELVLPVPAGCHPCDHEVLPAKLGAVHIWLTPTQVLWSGETFLAYVPLPREAEAAPEKLMKDKPSGGMTTHPFASIGDERIVSVQVPPTSIHQKLGRQDGLGAWVKLPEGEVRGFMVPKGLRYPQAFLVRYNLREELAKVGRCCCTEKLGGEEWCRWFRNDLLKSGPHCPRVVAKPGEPMCTRKFCGLSEEHCVTTHHRPGSCSLASSEPESSFQGGAC